jgi:acetolactate synthase-1/2/3 large subunit
MLFMKGLEIFFKTLQKEKVEFLFSPPNSFGESAEELFDKKFSKSKYLKRIVSGSEQGASHMADGYARVTGNPGVVVCDSDTSGTNTITGLQTANMDSASLVVFVCHFTEDKELTNIFEHIDHVGISRSCTKHNFLVREISDLSRVIREALHLSITGRPGTILVDISREVLDDSASFSFPLIETISGYKVPTYAPKKDIQKAIKLIMNSKRPIVFGGGGIVISDATKALQKFANRLKIPVTLTLMGLGGYPPDDPMRVSWIGMHGSYFANMAVHHSDLVICIGARFDDRSTGGVFEKFAPGAKVIHIDIDPSTINKNIKVHCPVVGDAKSVISQLDEGIPLSFKPEKQARDEWFTQIKEWETSHPTLAIQKGKQIKTSYAIDTISKLTNGKAVVVTDVGQHQMWVAQYYQFKNPRNQITSGGLGTMGFGFPAAIGAKLGRPKDMVIAVCGDGSFQMNMQEFSTAVENNLDLKIILINNGHHGMVRQWQTLFFDKNYSCCKFDLNPDYTKIAKSYGAKSFRIDSPKDLKSSIKEGFSTKGVVLMEIVVDHTEMVYPMLTPGGTMDNMLFGPDDPIPSGPIPDMS